MAIFKFSNNNETINRCMCKSVSLMLLLITILIACFRLVFFLLYGCPVFLRIDILKQYCENKRLKGIGIGAPEGPISLDDFRSLQRSNRVFYFRFMGLMIVQTINLCHIINNPDN